MLYLLVQVSENIHCIISERVVSIETTNNKFFDLFDAITLGTYSDREVQVFVRKEKSESWREVDNGLRGDLKMLEVLGFLQVKFCLFSGTNIEIPDTSISTQKRPNAFNILMENSSRPLLPQRRPEHNNWDRLYNEIIELFEDWKVGWTGGSHDTIGKNFVNRLTNALWYIDPHLSTLHARSYHLPVFFTQLKTYKNGQTYNKFYHTSHHRKDPLSQQKLSHLSSSLELSINQPWASNDIWNQVMPAIFSLIEILRKYSEYLVATNVSMNRLHKSDESARNPENSSTMYRISACEWDSLNENYIQLNNALLEKPTYEYIDIQPYLPTDIMKR